MISFRLTPARLAKGGPERETLNSAFNPRQPDFSGGIILASRHPPLASIVCRVNQRSASRAEMLQFDLAFGCRIFHVPFVFLRGFAMALVKSTDITFEFPVSVVDADGQRWTCRKLDNLVRGVPIQMRRGIPLGRKITDASGRRWIVRSYRKNGRMERWSLFRILVRDSDWRLEYELEELPPVGPRKGKSSRNSVAGSATRKAKRPDLDGSESAPAHSDGIAEVRPDSPGTASNTFAILSGGETRIVRASDTVFDFPLAGFGSKEGLLCYSDLNALTHASWAYVREETLIGMELVDNRLRRWIVRSVDPKKPPRVERWWHFGPDTSAVEFDLDLEEIEPTTLPDVKRRLLEEWELEDADHEDAVRSAPDLAAMFEAAYQQGTGLLD
jgi:hypothetical protein